MDDRYRHRSAPLGEYRTYQVTTPRRTQAIGNYQNHSAAGVIKHLGGVRVQWAYPNRSESAQLFQEFDERVYLCMPEFRRRTGVNHNRQVQPPFLPLFGDRPPQFVLYRSFCRGSLVQDHVVGSPGRHVPLQQSQRADDVQSVRKGPAIRRADPSLQAQYGLPFLE
jgi:hypothetical protein